MVILIADNDLDDRYIFRDLLLDFQPHAQVIEAEDGPTLFRQLENGLQPHYIFMDIDLPAINGWECLRQLKGNPEYEPIPIIVYTSSANPQHYQLAHELGALCYCRKTFEEGQLQKLLPILLSSSMQDLSDAVKNFRFPNQH